MLNCSIYACLSHSLCSACSAVSLSLSMCVCVCAWDIYELKKAFAGQVLANLKALDSDAWAKENLGLSSRVGEIPYERINTMGGSLSIGHPFAATGVRLLSTATNRLHMDCGQFALIAACADGGMATAVLLERCDD